MLIRPCKALILLVGHQGFEPRTKRLRASNLLLNFQALTIAFVPKTYDFTPLLFNSLRRFVPKFFLGHLCSEKIHATCVSSGGDGA